MRCGRSWNTKRRLPFIVCRPRKTNFRFSVFRLQKKIEVCRFPFPFAANKRNFSSSIRSIFHIQIYWKHMTAYTYIWIYTYMNKYTFIYLPIYLYISNYNYKYMLLFQMKTGKRKLRWFYLTHLPFAHPANGNLSFIRLFVKKRTEVMRLQTDYTDLPIYGEKVFKIGFTVSLKGHTWQFRPSPHKRKFIPGHPNDWFVENKKLNRTVLNS